MLLASVLFLTGIWHEPIITAGLRSSPDRRWRRDTAIPGARLGGRFGAGRVGAIGAVLFALGGVWWITPAERCAPLRGRLPPGNADRRRRRRLGDPVADGAVAATLPPERLATGIAVQTTGRQIGSALGFAIFVAVLGTPHNAADFREAWGFMIVASLLAGVTLAAVGRSPVQARVSESPTGVHTAGASTRAA